MDAELMRLIESLTLSGVLLYAWISERRERQELTRAIIELARIQSVAPGASARIVSVPAVGDP